MSVHVILEKKEKKRTILFWKISFQLTPDDEEELKTIVEKKTVSCSRNFFHKIYTCNYILILHFK